MPGVPDGTVALDVGVDHPAQIGGVALELLQVAVGLIAGKGRRQHERRVAQQIVPHVGLIDHLVLRAAEDLPDQPLVGGCTGKLSDGNLFQVDGRHPVALPMARRGRKGKQHVFLRQCGGGGFCPHIVAHKDDIFRPACPQGIHDRVKLGVAHDHKDHVVGCFRLQLRRHRDTAERHAG